MFPDQARRRRTLLLGCAAVADTDVVTLNAGELLMTAGLAESLGEGVAMAEEAVGSRAAFKRLSGFIEATKS